MKVQQTELSLPSFPRGFHLITRQINGALKKLGVSKSGLCHVFLQHTSASLTLNENADPDVRTDFEVFFNYLVPESFSGFHHTSEGRDDMPAHLKSSLLGPSVTVPLTKGLLNLGIWQGIYLCEHRNNGGGRRIVITVMAED